MKAVFRLCGARPFLNEVCRSYLHWFRGDGEFNLERSGELEVLRHLLPQCSVVFDVGANKGDWTRTALSINQTARYRLFEPSQAMFGKLAARSFPDSVTLERKGLSNNCGKDTLFSCPGYPSMNTLNAGERAPEKWSVQEEVSLTTIDTYCHRNQIASIDFIKLDVEGHELKALYGAQQMLEASSIRYVQFEYNSCAIFERVFLRDFFNLLQPKGYVIYKVTPRGLIRVPQWHWGLETFSQSNFLAALDELPKRLIRGTAVFNNSGYCGHRKA